MGRRRPRFPVSGGMQEDVERVLVNLVRNVAAALPDGRSQANAAIRNRSDAAVATLRVSRRGVTVRDSCEGL